MCLAYPARVRSLLDADTAEVTAGGRAQRVVLLTLAAGPPVRRDDWLLVQSGLAVQRLSAGEAHERMRMLNDLIGGDNDG
jgi:hydrogenase maturation factor